MIKNKLLDFVDQSEKIPGVSEVIINRLDNIFLEKNGELVRLDVVFSDKDVEDFCQYIAKYNDKKFDSSNPILDGNLPDGSRVNLLHKEYTNECHAITIRRFSSSIKSFDSSPGIFGLTEPWIKFFKTLIKARRNIVIAGGTGSGKTTLMNLLLQEISSKERIITIEDTRELQFDHPNLVQIESQIGGLSVRDLTKNALRMRPDRIIIGECRGGEAFDLLQAMNTGHEGSMTSIHANSPEECLVRLENLYILSGQNIPLKALRFQISKAVDFLIQVQRTSDGQRVITHVVEVSNMEGEKILLQDIGTRKSGTLNFTGLVPTCFEKLQHSGLPKDFFAKT